MATYRGRCVKNVVKHNKFYVLKCFVSLVPIIVGIYSIVCSLPTYAEAKASTLSVNYTTEVMTFSVNPSPEGAFAKSPTTTIGVETDNFSGYTMVIKSSTASTSLEDDNNNEIQSISSSISESTFSSGSTYKNKWGYKPSQYVTTSGNVDTTVQNTDYLPAPDNVTGTVLAKTTSANVSADTYTISSAAKVDTTLPAGTYTYTFVLMIVPNDITYSIAYDKSTDASVGSMPSPNPQVVTIEGGTAVTDSYTTLSNALPTLTDKTFGGWCDTTPTLNTSTLNYECSGTTYQPGGRYDIDQTVDGTNITLYAIWLSDPFPTVWSQMGKCIFDGAINDTDSDPDYIPGRVHGSECQTYMNDYFIDTGIALYSNANYQKDYQVHFTIDRYISNQQANDQNQATIFNDKLSSSVTESPYSGKSPGIVVRRNSNNIEIKSTYTTTPLDGQEVISRTGTGYAGTDVSIFRINGVMYTSIDNGPLVMLQDMTNPAFTQQFGLSAWFGGYPDNVDCTVNCTAAKRFLEGELSDMYIKLGDFDEDNLHEIIFNENYGAIPATTSYLILDGDTINNFPTPTRTGWFFGGWWTASTGGTQKTAPYTPTTSEPLYAHWYKSVSDAQIADDTISLSVNDTETIEVINSADLEPYTFASDNSSVATVNNAGLITAIGNGVATITMTGSITGDTQTITVTVGNVITVTFDPDFGSEATFTRNVADGGSFDNLPTYSRTGYELEGWYTGHDGAGTKLTTSTIFGGSTPTIYYANWEAVPYVCKVATTLHQENCIQGNNLGCRKAGWATDAVITYGYLIQDSSTVTAGAAYDCDVDYDGIYDDETERFYYFGTENGNAKLVHYINQQNNASVAYNVAVSYLPNYELDQQNPTIPVWDNPYLVTYDSGDYAGKAARFMSYDEVTPLWTGGTGKIKPTDYTSVFIFENTNFATDNTTNGLWLERTMVGTPQNDGKNRIQTSALNLNHDFNTSANASRATIVVPEQYIEPYTPSVTTYTITFDPHNETSSWNETIDAGDDLSDVYPATNPTYANHLFQGWFTAQSGGSQISSSTEPSGNTTYHAQWLKTVALATLESDSFTIEEGNTATINVTNSSELEAYSFTPVDSSVATVSSAGVITAVSTGTTTINMVGTVSGATKTISVTVTAPVTTYEITFNPHNGTSSWTETIDIGDDLSDVYPATAPTYADHLFQGWFTAQSGGSQISSSTEPSGNTTYHAQWLKTVALAVLGSNSITVVENETEAVIVTNTAELEGYSFSSLNPLVATVDSSTGIVTGVAEGTTTIRMTGDDSGAYIDIPVTVTPPQTIATVCRLAVAGSLHTSPSGYYGQIASNTTPQPGDAYDCDVNNDDNYNATNERFYYLGQDGSNNAVLVAWNSYNSTAWAPGTSSDNVYTYADALNALPGNSDGEWDHPGLIEQATGKAARFTNYTEVVSACGNIDVTQSNALNACDYFMEHSAYDSGGRSALWLNYDGTTYRRIHTGANNHLVASNISPTGSSNMARPAIVVPYDLIEKYEEPPVQQATVTFNSMGGSTVNSVTLESGTALGSDYPSTDPTKTDNRFFGWYTDTTYNVEVTPETVVNDDVTYYARWIGDTSNFPIEFAEINECVFNNTSNLSGTYCTQPKNISYVDTNIKLFTATDDNYTKDFEIGFTITEYNTSSQSQNQATLVNSKQEATGYPGFVLRRTGSAFQLTAKFAGSVNNPIGTDSITPPAPGTLHHVRIVRRDNTIYYAWNDGELTKWWDLTGFSTRFDTEVWFGAASDSNDAPWRGLVGRLTDMYVRLGTYEESSSYTIRFDPNGGTITSGSASVDIDRGDSITSFPTVTRPGNYTLVGWFDENENPVTTSTVPTKSQTYHAEWSYNSTKTPVTFDVANDALRSYYTMVNSYVPQITTFNEANPINSSTWGVAKSTYLAEMEQIYVTNHCSPVPQEDSQIDWGGTHTVNCSKPASFDTGRTNGVNVYEYDIANDTKIGTALPYTKSSSGVIHNLIPGHDYIWEDVNDNTIYGVISAVSSADNRRELDVGNVWNVRDLGGLPVDSDGDGTVDGSIEYGKLVRGGRLNTTSSNVTELENLGMNKEYDVAGPGELNPDVQFGNNNYVNDEVIHYNFDYGTVVDNENTYDMARKAVTDIMNEVINGNNVYFHCRVGADRTGTIAYLLEGLLGVPDEQRYQDYEITSISGLNDRTRYYAEKSSTNNKKFLFMMGYVPTNDDILAWYLMDSSDTGALARVAAFKSAMVVSNNSNNNNGMGGQSSTNSTQNSPQNSPLLNTMSMVSNQTNNTSDEEPDTTDYSDLATNSIADASAGYVQPLGESETTDAPSNVGLVVAGFGAVASGVGASYLLAKQDGETS